jgi:hypothetical protein
VCFDAVTGDVQAAINSAGSGRRRVMALASRLCCAAPGALTDLAAIFTQ